jgi:hypothetical protein
MGSFFIHFHLASKADVIVIFLQPAVSETENPRQMIRHCIHTWDYIITNLTYNASWQHR